MGTDVIRGKASPLSYPVPPEPRALQMCGLCKDNSPPAKAIAVSTLMFLSFHTGVSSPARAAYLFVLSGQIFVMLLLRETATSIRSTVLLALSSSRTSALLWGDGFVSPALLRVAIFQRIFFFSCANIFT
ncbi:hypothetical protein H1C71_040411 [Ictidomys tridecemlineatus]|nr:hypothetical protein H1C71_040411 [Ictidomys tridecemlineatus]